MGVTEGIEVGKRIIVFVDAGVETIVAETFGNCVIVDTAIESALGEQPTKRIGKIVNINIPIFIIYPSILSSQESFLST
jgi:hypothetical protein